MTINSTIEDITRALSVPGLEKLCIFITLGNLTIGHANAIIVDLNRDEIWTFEPHGKRYTKRKEFIPQRAEAISIIKTELAKHFPSRIFQVHGIEELPFTGPQKRACKNNTCSVRIDQEKLKRETKGYCAAWTLMYIHYHAINPGMSSVDVNNLIDIRFSADELYNRVRGYAHGISQEWYPSGQLKRKEMLKRGELNGLVEVWREDGSKKSCGVFKAMNLPNEDDESLIERREVPDGRHFIWDKNDNLIQTIMFENGVMTSSLQHDIYLIQQ